MKLSKVLALLLAVVMLFAMFSACSNDPAEDKDGTSGTEQPGDTEKDDTKDPLDEGDAPVEKEMLTISWLGSDPGQWEYNMDQAKDFETWKAFMALANDTYKLEIDWGWVASDAYANTINGYLASNTEPNCFISGGMANDAFVNTVANGKLASLDDVLEYSEEAAELFEEGGPLAYLRAWATLEDGNWYELKIANNTTKSMNLSNSNLTQRLAVQVHGVYNISIRQDWLDKCNLSMPATPEEFREALEAFQTEDVNDNGTADERFVTHLGRAGIYTGTAAWFGLPSNTFKEDPGTGIIELPHLMEGYKPWLTYMNSLYNDGTILNNDGGYTWGYTIYCASNEVSAYYMMQDYIWRVSTGDPNANYQPLPIIQAIDSIEARQDAQECVAGNAGFSFSSKANYEAAARFVDFTHSQAFAYLFELGIEGVAWDWTADGSSVVKYELEGIDKASNGPARTNYLNQNGLPGVHIDNVWGINCQEYSSVDEALASGETYTEQFTTKEEWQELNGRNGEPWPEDAPSVKMLQLLSDYGLEKLHPNSYYTFLTRPTTEELELSSMYAADIDTFLLELTTSVIIGTMSVDQVDEQMQFAYDNLYLEEYHKIMQSRYNRFLVAMGLEAVELTIYD